MSSADIDLTPFGFTPTESMAYASLLSRGPTSAYALAKELGLARANVYHALDGLLAKGGCELVGSSPKIYRAASPNGLLAQISEAVVGSLDRLEAQFRERPGRSGAPVTTRFFSERAFREMVLRTALRAADLSGIAPGDVLLGLNPIWRRRAADGLPSRLWIVGADTTQLPFPLAGKIPLRHATDLFGAEPVLVLVESAAMVGRRVGDQLEGYWTSDPLLAATAKGTLQFLTRG